MALNVDMGGNTLYVSDIVYGDNTPGSLSGTSLTTNSVAAKAVSITGSTYAPTAAQTGYTFILNRAAGSTVTLPAPVVGTTYDFIVGTLITSNTYKIITSAGTVFINGGLFMDKALTVTRYDSNGTSDVSINLDSATTGGLVGDTFTLVCSSATEWTVSGIVSCAGTLATPFATS